MNNEAAYMKVSSDKKSKPNLYFVLEDIEFDRGYGRVELKA